MKILNSGGKEYNTFGGGEKVEAYMGETWWKNLHAKRIANKIKSRQVFDETVRKIGDEISKLKLTNIRFLSQEFAQLTETVIIGNYVAISIFTENPYGILIKDPTVVKSYKKNFEILWSKAKS